MTGIIGLRRSLGRNACEIADDGSCVWRLEGNLRVELHMEGDVAHWHLENDGDE